MARGGYRPGAGRPPKLKVPKEPKKRGRPPKNAVLEVIDATLTDSASTGLQQMVNPFMPIAQALQTPALLPPDRALDPNPPVSRETEQEDRDIPMLKLGELDPLTYMLRVMNDSSVDDNRRDKLAIAAAPFIHRRAGEVGKKGEKEKAAKDAGAGRFGAAAPPRLVANNT